MERSVDDDSFFLFFKNIPSEENVSNVEEKTIINEQERMRIDYDIARIIIDDIIPFSLEYYLQMVIDNDEESDDEDNKVILEIQDKKKLEKQKSNLSKKSKKNSVVFKYVNDSNYGSEGGSSKGVSQSPSPTKK